MSAGAKGWELSEGFLLGDVRVDPRSGELSGPAGTVQLDPKVMDVLLWLATHAGEVVAREELLRGVWAGTVVSDAVLSRCVYELRLQLREASGESHFKEVLETLPKRGYRLNCRPEPAAEVAGAVAHEAPTEVRPDWRQRVVATAAVGLLAFAAAAWWIWRSGDPQPVRPEGALALHASIAVLPFADMSAERDQEYFGDGIAEEILNLLAQGGAIKVIARTSSFSFKGQAVDVATIASKLGVAHVLEGSVRTSGDRVRITAQLVDARDGAHLWSQTYDRRLDDVFAIQTEIAASVAGVLRTLLLEVGPAAPGTPRDLRAYDHYMRGRFLFHRRGPGDLERARDHYQAAVEFDPEYALAWEGLAGAYEVLVVGRHVAPELGLPLLREAAERAVELDPNLAEARVRLASALFLDGDRERAWDQYRAATALGPDRPLVLARLANIALLRGDLEESIELERRAVSIDPLSFVHRANLGHRLKVAGRLKEARAQLLAARELSPALEISIDLYLAEVQMLEGRYAEALKFLQHLAPGALGDAELVRFEALLAMVWHSLGREAESQAAIERLAEDTSYAAAARLADVHAWRGEQELAWRWLGNARERLRGEFLEHDFGWHWLTLTLLSPFLKPLHDDPRWVDLLNTDH
jgi:TolB-like protein/DNA-binding winged helix-turn-helix (wHTH) protein/Flp pilus assembly protein TadD